MTERASKPLADSPAVQPAGQTIAFEDQGLIERCRQGEMQAFGLLVAKYQDRIFNLVRRMCPRQADAEELAQEAFLRALEKLDQFRGQSQFYTWLFRIASNLAISHCRRNGQIRFAPLGDREDGAAGQAARHRSMAQPAADPQAAAMSAETAARVTEALDGLDEEHRLIVVLRDVEDMDYAAIAAVLEVPIGTVKSRLHRARTLLKEKLTGLV
ncbi:MAG: sigma-70 family RNA polymerase sigma factor [Phycisphaerae bacterium]